MKQTWTEDQKHTLIVWKNRLNTRIDKVDKKVDLLREDIFYLFKINGFKTE